MINLHYQTYSRDQKSLDITTLGPKIDLYREGIEGPKIPKGAQEVASNQIKVILNKLVT